ncbi:MAG: cysteine--tRNA ligase [Candidatus Thermoplasmatota archaeon]|nr:cysteine--tRNA ligase [Candidatus Thermoplasmatota archaeon]
MREGGPTMTLSVYNTLTGKMEEFVPLEGKRVYMFVCGPTVYDHSHIGHARTNVAMDAISKYLSYRGYSVFYLMNVTDVDDKMIDRANEVGIPVEDLAEMYFRSFREDMGALGVDSVNLYAKATEHIPEIIWQIGELIKKGAAYESNGSVYFEVNKFPGFGKLSNQKLDMLEAGARVQLNEDKRNPEDFALWKAYKEGEPWWDSPWGKGRPGWHVEDTAISVRYFGSQYDMHGGGRDLIFPHHDSEIAIAESITGKEPFVRYWLHAGFLQMRGEKMSKSLGNVLNIKEMLKKTRPEVIRFFLLNTHYRSPIDYSEELLAEAGVAYDRLEVAVDALRTKMSQQKSPPPMDAAGKLGEYALEARSRFIKAMDEDFNTREAIAVLFDLARESNKALSEGSASTRDWADALSVFEDYGNILGFFRRGGGKEEVLDGIISILMEEREKARQNKDWATADRIRDRLKEAGVLLEDGKDGPSWRLAC